MGSLITALLTIAAEAMKLANDPDAEKVDAIVRRRPKLAEAEATAYRRAAARLGRRPR